MDCETCKEKRKVISQTPKDVPYIVHECAVARLERVIKRLWKLVILLIILLVASLSALIWRESQYQTIETTITQENAEGYNNYIGNDGDIVNGNADDNPRLYAGVIKKLKA